MTPKPISKELRSFFKEDAERSPTSMRSLVSLLNATKAQTMVEYALLSGFVAIVGAMTLLTAPTTTDNVRKVLNDLAKYLALAAGAATQTYC